MFARTCCSISLAIALSPLAWTTQEILPTGARGPARNRLPALGSALVHVPGDHATVQTAIDNVAPGTRIVVHGGTHGSILIDKPLTLLGDPAPLFQNGGTGSGATAYAPIRLAGPGSGRVVLCDVDVGGTVNGFLFSFTQAGIQGGGFDELHLYGCDVAGPFWTMLTGIAAGAPGIDVSVASVLVSGSEIAGSLSSADDCYSGGPPGPPGIRATGATVVVLDSSVRGGGSVGLCGLGACPTSGGAGGAGIEAATLFHAGCTMTGGSGAVYFDTYPPGTPCGEAPDGLPVNVTTEIGLPAGLSASGSPRRGQVWALAWSPGSPAALFVARERVLPPLSIPFLGWSFLDAGPVGPWLQGFSPSGSRTLLFPDSAGVVGLTVTAQLLDLEAGLLRPVTDCVRP